MINYSSGQEFPAFYGNQFLTTVLKRTHQKLTLTEIENSDANDS
jgi:hypothetical protein